MMFQSYALLSLFDDNDDEVTPLKSAVCGVWILLRVFLSPYLKMNGP